MKTVTNEPIHPTPQGDGLTKREYFAGLAMQGNAGRANWSGDEKLLAGLSVKIADALIEELNKNQ